MRGKQRFFECGYCGNMVGLINDEGIPLVCCGYEMTELIANTAEASTEKHLPDVTRTDGGISVNVGSVPHPMEAGHYISFVYVETEAGGQRKGLQPGDKPSLAFAFTEDKPVAVYAYCNLHGLWKTEIE